MITIIYRDASDTMTSDTTIHDTASVFIAWQEHVNATMLLEQRLSDTAIDWARIKAAMRAARGLDEIRWRGRVWPLASCRVGAASDRSIEARCRSPPPAPCPSARRGL